MVAELELGEVEEDEVLMTCLPPNKKHVAKLKHSQNLVHRSVHFCSMNSWLEVLDALMGNSVVASVLIRSERRLLARSR